MNIKCSSLQSIMKPNQSHFTYKISDEIFSLSDTHVKVVKMNGDLDELKE